MRIRHFSHFPILLIFSLIPLSCQKQKQVTTTDDSGYQGFVLLPSSKTHIKTKNVLPETEEMNHFIWDSYYNGGGVAAGDINNDGLVDLYFTNTMSPNVLYINKGNFQFEDVTKAAGVEGGDGPSWGATMADINGDGWLDIYVCKSGPDPNPATKRNKCYINQKDGTFKEMAREMGIDNPGYSVQAAFFDYDRDNDLDLFVMNQPSNARTERVKYGPDEASYINESTSDRLYRNDGNMHFTDVTASSGALSFVYGLGLKICDLNGDHWPDVYIASDYDWPDLALINNRDGTFTNEANAYFSHIANFSMGMDIGDINNDALDDVFVLDMAGIDHYRSKTNMPSMNPKKFWKLVADGKHYQYMHNVLQLNRGHEVYSDIAYIAGVSKTDWSWGALMMDADNDGLQDIYVTNGIKRDIRNSDFEKNFKAMIDNHTVPDKLVDIIKMIPSTPMANFMFHNQGDLHFKDDAAAWGLGQPSFSNGCAFADLDQDGDLDIITNNVDAEAFIYENKANESGRHYIQFQLKSGKNHRPVECTRVSLYKDGRVVQTQFYHPVHGFMSSSEPLVHFGLGDRTALDSVIFIWPDQNISTLSNPAVDQRYVVDQDEVIKTRKYIPQDIADTWTQEKSEDIKPAFTHKENDFDDYAQQPLLPYRMSTLGPALAVADVNGDKLEDFFVGGAFGQPCALYLQDNTGHFNLQSTEPWSKDLKCDALGALFFDADGDGDQDLYVATGGSEYLDGDPGYKDYLFINNGKGSFTISTGLPDMFTSSKAVAAADWDHDGDLDLFVGSRNKPRKYPYADRSYFLENNHGVFTDVTKKVWGDSSMIGMITDAKFADKDNDGDMDLLICGDWMAPTWLINDGGHFKKVKLPGLEISTGWWNTVELADINGDGILDILAGNAGTNNKFKATPKEPFIVFANDFDLNGNSDIVLATEFNGKEVPVRGRECSSQQLPYIAKEFPTYDGFAKASVQDIIGKEKLKGSLRLELTEFRNGIFWGTPDGDYKFEAFPQEAQLSPIVGFCQEDANGDGKPDIITAGNLYDTEVETTRYDAGQGMIMSWTDQGWKCYPPNETGFYAGGNVRAIKPIRAGSRNAILTARGNGPLSLYEFGKEVVN